ncbi:tryptophan synthase beta subunit-like PLP-dependent enzyme [Laetiporus sulphureus 93-53]|uniref:L-serine ammonia-lyase n=1 Tax=Laetiporus sulphureus 93-53 TaxID=1314785 RepID=A0A165BVL1_9APHY|nr:tryptophan synthase beta subunit-like PLP-dependent enzyme [Laetiporus sulphureus 93-53]KZT01733.1 tryptophan synthase beta subunit-like PLP-dependent enzyme [Laetiporus sulphureus 93-53]
MADSDRDPEKLWLETPLVYSPHISARLGYIPRSSLYHTDPPTIAILQVPRNNAGLAVACVSKRLGARCTVYLHEGVSASTIDFLQREGRRVMVPPHDDPTGIARQLPPGIKPDAVFCSVGGRGLAGGIMYGCKSIGWDDVLLVALEPTGSNCFYHAPASSTLPEDICVEHNAIHNVEVAHLSKLTSRAISLGASSPAATVVKMALKRSGGAESVCMPDETIMQAALLFAEEYKVLVELACAATLTPAYKPDLFNKLSPPSSTTTPRTAVFIVCGGFKISLEGMEEYKKLLEADAERGGQWTVLCHGEQWDVTVEK